MNSSSTGPSPATTPLISCLRVNKALIEPVLRHPQRIRNVCILAHVDHGKTTLTDTLLASNGIISFKQAGKLRYLDSREDEQMRGITMEASAITLLYDAPSSKPPTTPTTPTRDKAGSAAIPPSLSSERYVINLIDSPGHVDFSRQVVTATRLCDGCLVLVDAVEGVCTQTLAVLRQARRERLTACLVINKIDRLISELKLSTTDAARWLQRLLEQVNAARASIKTLDNDDGGDDGREDEARTDCRDPETEDGADGDSSNEERPFGAVEGNVIFASSTDGWAFTIERFVILYAAKLEMNPQALRRALWGDYYFDAKTKRVLGKRAAEKEGLQKPMLAQFVLDPLWSVYDATVINWDEAKIGKISSTTGARLSLRELKNRDGRALLRSLMGQWLPLAETVFSAVVAHCPSPLAANRIRLDSIVRSGGAHLPPPSRRVVELLASPEHPEEEPVVAFISKFFSVTTQVSSRTASCEDLRTSASRDGEGQGGSAVASAPESSSVAHGPDGAGDDPATSGTTSVATSTTTGLTTERLQQFSLDATSQREKLIGMARLFHGTLRRGQSLFILGPQHVPGGAATTQGTSFVVNELYLLMGRDLEPVEQIYAGSVFGIGGLEALVEGRKNATLASTLDAPCLAPPRGEVVPIVHVAVRPQQLGFLTDVVGGLKRLCQADPCAETFLEEESGEYILATAGELHLEQCLRDLRERYLPPGVDLVVSSPIVPYRETLGAERNRREEGWRVHLGFADTVRERDGLITLSTADGRCRISARALSLPEELRAFICAHRSGLLDALGGGAAAVSASPLAADMAQLVEEFAACLRASPAPWREMSLSQVWAIGPRRDPTNLLICAAVPEDDGRQREAGPAMRPFYMPTGYLRAFQSPILTAFQLITDKGPLAHEPMMGVAFIVEALEVEEDSPAGLAGGGGDAAGAPLSSPDQEERRFDSMALLSAQLIPLGKTLFKAAFFFWSSRLMLAVYRCSVQTTAEMLGRVYSTIAKRRGRILAEDYQEGTGFFTITARLPVVESFGLADDLRGRTAGVAIPQLVFAGYDRLEEDPFWVPTTEEELAEYGKLGSENVSMRYVTAIRERKGLYVERKIVQFAEKQRTLRK